MTPERAVKTALILVRAAATAAAWTAVIIVHFMSARTARRDPSDSLTASLTASVTATRSD